MERLLRVRTVEKVPARRLLKLLILGIGVRHHFVSPLVSLMMAFHPFLCFFIHGV